MNDVVRKIKVMIIVWVFTLWAGLNNRSASIIFFLTFILSILQLGNIWISPLLTVTAEVLHSFYIFLINSVWKTRECDYVGGGTPAAGTPEKAENGSAKRGGWPKGKKRKKIPRDQTAPRQPLTGKKIN